VDQQAIGVLDFQVMGVRCVQLNNATLHRIVEHHYQRLFKQFFFVFEFLRHERLVSPLDYQKCSVISGNRFIVHPHENLL